MIRRLVFVAAMIAIMAAASLLRVPSLGNRPFHGDEAVHAFKFRELWEQRVYRYDPNEFHGPTLYYLALPTVALNHRQTFAQTQESDYRLAIAIFGIALVPLLALVRDGLGGRATVFAAVLIAISPAFVFYSRYYIQEVLLAFFTLVLIVTGWRYKQSGKIGWLWAAGVSAGLMIATKETAVLAFVAAGIAFALTRKSREGEAPAEPPSPSSAGASPSQDQLVLRRRSVIRAFASGSIALGVAYLFLSGFLSNPAGPLGYFQAFSPWMRRAGGTDIHNHPWYYYLSILTWNHRVSGPIWSEGLILCLALIGGISVLNKKWICHNADPGFLRFIAIYTLVLTAIYSAIPYKTPWCVLSFLTGLIMLAGVGACALLRFAPGVLGRVVVSCLLIAGAVQLRGQAYRTSFIYQVDNRNPYVYAQPVPDVIKLGKRVDELARVHPQHESMIVKVISSDEYYWPLPWYIRQMKNVGYWTRIPEDPMAPIVIASPEFDEALTKKLDPTHLMTGIYGLRPGVFLQVWVKMDLWTEFIKQKSTNKTREEASGPATKIKTV